MSDIRYEQDMCVEAVKSAYEKGLDTAYNIIKDMISCDSTDPMMNDIFDDDWYYGGIRTCLEKYTISEIIDRIKVYKNKQFSKVEEPKIISDRVEPKIGDRVKLIKNRDYFGHKLFPKGTIGIIDSISSRQDKSLSYKIYNEDYSDFWFYSRDMFEVIKD